MTCIVLLFYFDAIIKFKAMNKREAKREALIIASVVINELQGNECTNSQKVKKELEIIATALSKRADKLKQSK